MSALHAAARLHASLDEVAAALGQPDADALANAEPGLAAALDALRDRPSVTPDEREALAAVVIRARATLARCRVLGASLADAARLTLATNGGGYGPSGDPAGPAAAIRGHRLRARL